MAERTTAPSPFDKDNDSDVILVSSDNMVFYCHKILLTLVSPVFEAMFTLPVDQSNDVYDGRPCVTLAEDGDSLYLLLSWCDQRCTTRYRTVAQAELEKVLELADKYGMEAIMKHVENFMVNIEITNPVELVAISARFRLLELAQVAAKKALDEDLTDLISMAGVPAARHLSAYGLHALLQYHMNCTREASRAATDIDWLNHHRQLVEVSPFTIRRCEESGCKTALQYRNDYRWLKWWLAYMELAAGALARRPSANAITSSNFLEKVHAEISAITCHHCRKAGHDSILAFNNFLANEVCSRIEKVNSSRCSDDRG